MSTLEMLHEKRGQILEGARPHGVTSIRVFGSVVRGQDRPESDIDFLVVAGEETTPWFPAGLILDLQDLLGRRIEIVTEKDLNPGMRDGVLGEAVPI